MALINSKTICISRKTQIFTVNDIKTQVFFPEDVASPAGPGPGPASQEGPGPGPYGPIWAQVMREFDHQQYGQGHGLKSF